MSANNQISEQNVILTDRRKITVTGIKSVDTFDESIIVATTVTDTVINIEGSGLSIKDVNLDRGQIEADGYISAVFYESEVSQNKSSLLKRLFGKQ